MNYPTIKLIDNDTNETIDHSYVTMYQFKKGYSIIDYDSAISVSTQLNKEAFGSYILLKTETTSDEIIFYLKKRG